MAGFDGDDRSWQQEYIELCKDCQECIAELLSVERASKCFRPKY